MEKRKTVIFVIGVILIVSTFLICHKHTAYQTTQLDEVKLKDVDENNMFAIMVKGTDGKYTSIDQFPGEGYKLNEDKSGCMDNNNELISDSLSYDEGEQKVIVNTGQTSYCYLYFDKQLSVNDLRAKSGIGLSDEPVGGMYRYQGSSVDNYICLSGVGSNGCGTSGTNDKLYRIIGITENGNIKVIKQIKYGYYAWNTNYTDSTCDSSGCPEWPDSEIYKTLNGEIDSFLSKLSGDIKNKIADWEWYYGDIELNYAYKAADQIYDIETGQTETQYYGKTSSSKDLVKGQKWKKMDNKAKIGLIYLHDYYYQSTTSNNCYYNSSTYTQCKTGGWMNMSKNDSSSSSNEEYEWTMTRVGRENNSSIVFDAWVVRTSGDVFYSNLLSQRAVRPVFYLKSDVELGGTGSRTEPFYIKN